eukprot:CAMPEP_0117658340 /NCGR_PEP_ID=MMETSP0804-20121206/5814_1 /TAXON_ID=1074897 /ORGANISM="Tetraselmis astigmatica, Strain CCMP880" /LENGTH=52 /DNA_ID=CAMNT_0005464859 /DNA_START=110 /DNA_END=269 /DNA_ORIENTATION=+
MSSLKVDPACPSLPVGAIERLDNGMAHTEVLYLPELKLRLSDELVSRVLYAT